jgi:predicted NodU family carbamoyl transferase
MARYVLGLNVGFHDASAALLRDGQLRHLVPEERVSRRKHAIGQPPTGAVAAVLAAEGIAAESLDEIAIGWDFTGTSFGKSWRLSPPGLRAALFPGRPDLTLPPVRWVPHHLAHAASAYFGEPAGDAAILVTDGAGEDQSTTLAHGHGGKIEVLRQWPVTQSLGFYYAAASKWAGLGEWGAGKLMGLAAYGRPRPGLPLRGVPGGYELDLRLAPVADDDPPGGMGPLIGAHPAFEEAARRAFGCCFPYAERQGEEAIAYADFASTIQTGLEDAVSMLAAEARRLTSASTLVLAGGVAMNCSMIGMLARTSPFDRVSVPPVPNDVGVALGAALIASAQEPAFSPTTIESAYWGRAIDEDRCLATVREAGLHLWTPPGDELARVTARLLAEGRIVAWARGRAEIGERALGSRSLLADPRDRRNVERLNLIKGREMWRPVAPSVLAEHLDKVMSTRTGPAARFMLAAGLVRDDVRTRIPAVTHVDGSARPQAVERHTNPGYYALIEHFRDLTGVPLVINTSLNLAGEPIVDSAQDAVSTFVRSPGIDYLVLGDHLVSRTDTADS